MSADSSLLEATDSRTDVSGTGISGTGDDIFFSGAGIGSLSTRGIEIPA